MAEARHAGTNAPVDGTAGEAEPAAAIGFVVQTGRMRPPLFPAIAVAIALVGALPSAQMTTDQEGARRLAHAKRLIERAPLIDGHNDIPWRMREQKPRYDFDVFDLRQPRPTFHTDIARLRAGGLGGQFWSVYVPSTMPPAEAVRATLEQIDVVHRMMRQWPQMFATARTAAEVERVFKSGRIASMIGM